MAFIYKITNDINGKIYIGKTNFSIEKRFAEHCRDYKKERCKNRPLYRAMNKYGVEHFHIELLEETDDSESREIYWIDYYETYHNGYNATHGGDGKQYINHNEIIAKYEELQNAAETAKACDVDYSYVLRILKSSGIAVTPKSVVTALKTQKGVKMCDKHSHAVMKEFPSIRAAASFVIENKLSSDLMRGVTLRITSVCKKQRKNAYGFYWEYI